MTRPRRPIPGAVAALLLVAALPLRLDAQGGAAPRPIMTFPALLGLFQQPAGTPEGSILDWDAGSGPESRIRWAMQEIRESPEFARGGYAYERIGHVVVELDGQPAYRMVFQGRQVPGAWRVTLQGPRAGPYQVLVSTEGDAQGLDLDMAKVLVAAGWTVEPYKCRRETEGATYGNLVHVVTPPGGRPLWLHENWNYGQASGLGIAVTLLYFRDEADKVECVGG